MAGLTGLSEPSAFVFWFCARVWSSQRHHCPAHHFSSSKSRFLAGLTAACWRFVKAEVRSGSGPWEVGLDFLRPHHARIVKSSRATWHVATEGGFPRPIINPREKRMCRSMCS